MKNLRSRCRLAFALFLVCSSGSRGQEPSEAELSVRKLRPVEGLKVTLWAAEPQLANPVSLTVDDRGRVFVAETHRYRTSVLDIRHYLKWYYDDLACRTVEDRIAMCRKRMGDGAAALARESELIRFLEDRDGDGRADRSTVWAQGFDTMADGIASGVLTRGNDVYFANIPNLWLLRDDNDDGESDYREKLHTGYGVRFSLTGHDFHGLAFGPDGKLYFSMGDRGLNVVSREGHRLQYPDMGTVLRCNPDGTDLEVFAIGLRNPQELAFDKFGNLWTGDNDADMEEEARWVYVVEGGDTGWRIGYQFAPDLWIAPEKVKGHVPRIHNDSIWIQEGIWKGEAPYQVPPVALVRTGPSGLAYYPGTGFSERYDNHFFLCEFPGGIHSFSVKPRGASFEMTDSHKFLWDGLPTDIAFGPDSALYVSDWVAGWEKTGKGRIFRVADPRFEKSPEILEVRQILREGMKDRSLEDLGKFLAHRDQRVRLAAQVEIVPRNGATQLLRNVVRRSPSRMARIHAIWALGQLSERRGLIRLLDDEDGEIRAQAARMLGDVRTGDAREALTRRLKDSSPRVRFFAAIALGKLRRSESVGPLIEMLRENDGKDAYLRHAGVYALAWISSVCELLKRKEDGSRAVRMAVLLALRRMSRDEVKQFLRDKDPSIVFEAARAINDLPIPEAMDALSDLLGGDGCPEAAMLRTINACFRLGTERHAARLAVFARRSAAPEKMRVEALRALGAWEHPNGRDRVVGLWRPLPGRDAEIARKALRSRLKALLGDASAPVRMAAAEAAASLNLKEAGSALFSIFGEDGTSGEVRARMLRSLAELEDERISAAIEAALKSGDEALRREAVRLAPIASLKDGPSQLGRMVKEDASTPIRQAALSALGVMDGADTVLAGFLDEQLAGTFPAPLRLDLLDAAAQRKAKPVRDRLAKIEAARDRSDPLAGYREVFDGGDPKAGYDVFFERGETQCARCHRAEDRGSDVGPNLNGIAVRQPKEYILEALLTPNKQIAKGFQQVLVKTKSDAIEVGRVERETETELHLIRGDGTRLRLPKDQIAARRQAEKSAMPEGLIKGITRRELRDLMAFLLTLKDPNPPKKDH